MMQAKYSLIPQDVGLDAEDQRVQAETLIEKIKDDTALLDAREEELLKEIEDFNLLWESRRSPLDDELSSLRSRKEDLEQQMERAMMLLQEEEMPQAPGPACLFWVESAFFQTMSNIIVALNLAGMILAPKYPEYQDTVKVADNIFLIFYVFELSVKVGYHHSNLLFGRISVVWWNWLDLLIVISGVADQWLMGLIFLLSGSGPAGATSALRAVKFLRFLRMLRILKFIRAFLNSDMSWTETHRFEVFMSAVIACNAIIMSLELDIEWAGWLIVENIFMIIYSFELVLKIKREGCSFLTDTENLLWNYLDITLVLGGAMDLWAIPIQSYVQEVMLGQDVAHSGFASMSQIMSLLRLMRIMRVLRLVRLLKAIKPLYRLLLGVIESLKAMQWVMVLTLLMLYAGAIFWTSLVGKGLLYGGDPPSDGVKHFGSVPTSLFSLFRIMNGDTSVVKSVTSTVWGQLLFAVFMVLSNWAILAILTSVVSDNMIAASAKAAEEDAEKEEADNYNRKVGRLNVLFKEIDADGSGSITEEEWNAVCEDPGLFHELSDATHYSSKDLHDLFKCLAASKQKLGQDGVGDLDTMYFTDFIEHLRNDAASADKRSVLQMMAKMQMMERNLERQIHDLWTALAQHPQLGEGFKKVKNPRQKDAAAPRQPKLSAASTSQSWRKSLGSKFSNPITKL